MNTYHESERAVDRNASVPQEMLPNYKSVFVLGLLGLIFGVLGLLTWFCLPAMILGVIAMISGGGTRSLAQQNPGRWVPFSVQRVRSGYTMGVIGLCLGGAGLIINIAFLVFFFSRPGGMAPFIYTIF